MCTRLVKHCTAQENPETHGMGGTKCEKIDATKKDNELFTLRLKLSDREETIEKLNSKIIELSLKNKKLSDDNKLLRKGLKRFLEPKNEKPLIEF